MKKQKKRVIKRHYSEGNGRIEFVENESWPVCDSDDL